MSEKETEGLAALKGVAATIDGAGADTVSRKSARVCSLILLTTFSSS